MGDILKKKVIILFGGNTSEHLISCKSAKSILENIDKNIYDVIPVVISKDNLWYLYESDYSLVESWEEQKLSKIENIISFLKNVDVVFPIIHGNTGEDGKLQGLFELFDIKYVGSDVLTNAICMDKDYTKTILESYGIPTAPYITINKKDYDKNIIINFEYPVIVKPSSSGSSIGINVVDDYNELNKYIEYAFNYSDKVIVEKFINARELECAVLKTNNDIHISTIGEIKYSSRFYDYDAKYVNDSELIIPSTINEYVVNRIREYVKKICNVLNIKGLSRIDFLYEEDTDKIYLIEINTLPGFTTISMYPKLLNYDGITYKEILSKLIDNV